MSDLWHRAECQSIRNANVIIASYYYASVTAESFNKAVKRSVMLLLRITCRQ